MRRLVIVAAGAWVMAIGSTVAASLVPGGAAAAALAAAALVLGVAALVATTSASVQWVADAPPPACDRCARLERTNDKLRGELAELRRPTAAARGEA